MKLSLRARVGQLLGEFGKQPKPHDVQWSMRGRRRRQRVLVVVTSISQLPHVEALSKHKAFVDSLDPIICTCLDPGETGVAKFCEERRLALVGYKFGLTNTFSLGLVATARYYLSAVIFKALRAHRQSILLHRLADFCEMSAERLRQSAVARTISVILARHDIDILLLFEDNAEIETGIWIRHAETSAIPSLIVPFTFVDEVEPAESHYHDASYWADGTDLNRVAARKYPKWTLLYRDRLMLRRRGSAVLVAESFGFTQPNPWISNSSRATCLAVESRAMLEIYERHGLPEHQLKLTGSFTDDLIFQGIRQRALLQQELGLNADDPVLLCSFPPNQLTAVRPQCEFERFEDLIEFWMGQLRKLAGWQIVVRPHPAMAKADIAKLLHYPFVVTDVDTARLIPLCQMYNASVSSTIRWALACGRPVLNFDVFRYGYRDFADEPAVWTVDSTQAFSDVVDRIAQDKGTLDELSRNAQAAAPKWGMIDGQSGDRITSLVNSMIAKAGGRASESALS